MSRVFICYRRNDTSGHALALHEGLLRRGFDVFMDVDAILPGAAFKSVIESELNSAGTVLVLIGQDWLTPAANGLPRLADPNDLVRLEIDSALKQEPVLTVPVLVDGAAKPEPVDINRRFGRRAAGRDLAGLLEKLCDRNIVVLRHDRWDDDVSALCRVIDSSTPRMPWWSRLYQVLRISGLLSVVTSISMVALVVAAVTGLSIGILTRSVNERIIPITVTPLSSPSVAETIAQVTPTARVSLETRVSTATSSTADATPTASGLPVAVASATSPTLTWTPSSVVVPTQTASLSVAVSCQFVSGFKDFVLLIGASQVGECLENERYDAQSRTTTQRTTRGRLVWSEEDNNTVFTDGDRTWLWCYERILERPNDQVSHCPTPEYQAKASSGTVLVEDRFDSPNRGWLPRTIDSNDYVFDYGDGEYIVRKINANYSLSPSAFILGYYENMSLEVRARIVGNYADRYVVVGCRRKEVGNQNFRYYRLVVRTDIGQFRLSILDGGARALKDWTEASVINRGSEWNRIGLECIGDRITARINGEVVASESDRMFSDGQIWIGIGETRGETEVHFDDLVVQKR